jgi:hypothetical protein
LALERKTRRLLPAVSGRASYSAGAPARIGTALLPAKVLSELGAFCATSEAKIFGRGDSILLWTSSAIGPLGPAGDRL